MEEIVGYDRYEMHEMICRLLNSMYRKKNEAYGNAFGDNIKQYGMISALMRISDKYRRLETLILKNKDDEIESIEDTLLDLANYCIITYIEKKNEYIGID